MPSLFQMRQHVLISQRHALSVFGHPILTLNIAFESIFDAPGAAVFAYLTVWLMFC